MIEYLHWHHRPPAEVHLEELVKQIREIFFLSSSRQTWPNGEEQEKFFQRWTQFYFEKPDIWLAWKTSSETLLGYLMGCAQSQDALDYFQAQLPSQAAFSDLYPRFPAHLHINCRPEARGAGVGSKLVSKYKKDLQERRIHGVHVITSTDARNVSFYLNNGFTFKDERAWNSHHLLFMGCVL